MDIPELRNEPPLSNTETPEQPDKIAEELTGVHEDTRSRLDLSEEDLVQYANALLDNAPRLFQALVYGDPGDQDLVKEALIVFKQVQILKIGVELFQNFAQRYNLTKEGKLEFPPDEHSQKLTLNVLFWLISNAPEKAALKQKFKSVFSKVKHLDLSRDSCPEHQSTPFESGGLDLSEFPNLESLDLSGWKLDELPSGLEKCIKLKTLNLRGGTWRESDINVKLKNLLALEGLDLSDNPNIITYPLFLIDPPGPKASPWATYIQNTAPSKSHFPNLSSLNLSGTSIAAIPEWISQLYALMALNLEGCVALKHLPKRIEGCLELIYLNLEGTALANNSDILRSLEKRLPNVHLIPEPKK
jgi:Leucine-rich repeat (LRR) protein